MLAPLNTKVTLVVSFGPGQTGKTVGYTLLNGDGTTFQARTTSGVSEVAAGSGLYKVELASSVFTGAFDGYVLWDVAGAAPYASEDIRVANLIATSGKVTYVAPVLSSGVVQLVQGDDYRTADSRQLEWTSDSWPSLTGGSITLSLRPRDAQSGGTTFAGSVVSGSVAAVELTAAQTTALTVQAYYYALRSTLSDGHTVTLATGVAQVSSLP